MTPSHTHTHFFIYINPTSISRSVYSRWKSFSLPSLDSIRAHKLESSRRRGPYMHNGSHVPYISLQCWAMETWPPESEARPEGAAASQPQPAAALWERRPPASPSSGFFTEAKYLHFMWNIPMLNVGSIKKVKMTVTVCPVLDAGNHKFASSDHYRTCEA